MATVPVDIEPHSGFRLKKRLMPFAKVDKQLLQDRLVPCHELASHVAQWTSIRVGHKPDANWATLAIVERVIVGDEADQVLVAQLTNMRGVVFYAFVTGKAFKTYRDKIPMGTVVGVARPTILRPADVQAPVGLGVQNVHQLFLVGVSKDMDLCEAYVGSNGNEDDAKRCSATVDRRSGTLCDRHTIHMCGQSRNGRMELASGDSGIEIGWATTSVDRKNGRTNYQRLDAALATSARIKRTYTYIVPGKGPMNTMAKIINKTPTVDKAKVEKDKKAWTNFLDGRTDPGAMMIRKVKGIEEKKQVNVLSKEAFLKIHNKSKVDKEEEEKKVQSKEARQGTSLT
ncbi:hypothetical protein BC940DRAFT_289446 [Gongronella butleri]|nr:hypothetical protein BC940DRAFT_289446 [Gongronella butleri]